MRILHLFQWELKDIIKILHIIKEQGFDSIQLSPLQENKFGENYPWWGLYQPIDFNIGNQIGSKKELKELCIEAKKLEINIIVDVVLNHVASDDFGNVIPHYRVNKNLVKRQDFWKCSERISNWNNRKEVITKTMGLPTLDLSNHDLQDIIINFLNEYIDLGVDGFRFDASKQISLPSEDNDFWIRIMDSIIDKTKLNYAELIYTDQNIMDEYSKYVNILSEGNIEDKKKLITFFESHDTFNEFGVTRDMDDKTRVSEYKILVDNFKNTLYYTRPYEKLWLSKEIKDINDKIKA